MKHFGSSDDASVVRYPEGTRTSSSSSSSSEMQKNVPPPATILEANEFDDGVRAMRTLAVNSGGSEASSGMTVTLLNWRQSFG